MQVKLILFTFIWMANRMQFLSENRLNGCQIFGRFGFWKRNPNQISVFRTSLMVTHTISYFLSIFFRNPSYPRYRKIIIIATIIIIIMHMPVGDEQLFMLADDAVKPPSVNVCCWTELLLADAVCSLQVVQHVFDVVCHASWCWSFVRCSSLNRVHVRLHVITTSSSLKTALLHHVLISIITSASKMIRKRS